MSDIPAKEKLNPDMSFEEMAEAIAEYCPFCKKHIAPSNVEDVFDGKCDGFIFVHDDGVIHDEDFNFKAMH